MATEWYCLVQSKQYGPLAPGQLLRLARSGKLAPADLVRRGSDTGWAAAAFVQGLEFHQSPVRADDPAPWYCQMGGRTVGPLSSSQLLGAARSGKLSLTDLVRTKSSKGWVAAHRIPGLRFPPPAFPAGDRRFEASCYVPRPASGTLGESARQISTAGASVARDGRATAWTWLRAFVRRGQRLETARQAHSAAVGYGKAIALATACIVPFVIPTFGPQLGTLAIVTLAATSICGGAVLYRVICRPDRTSRTWAVYAFVFTSVFGAATLLQFLDLVTSVAHRDVPWQHAPLLLLKALGTAYSCATSPPACDVYGFLNALLSTILSVGLCEETLKLIPALVAAGSGGIRSTRGVMFIGAMSGLGFGISEALWVSFDSYLPNQVPFSLYLTRLFGCASGHAAITLLASAFLLRGQSLARAGSVGARLKFLFVAGLCVTGAAIIHGSYDTLLAHGIGGLAGLTMAGVVWGVIALSDQASN